MHESADPPEVHVTCLKPEGVLPPLFMVPAGEGDILAYYEIAQKLNVDSPVYCLRLPPKAIEARKWSLPQWVDLASAAVLSVSPVGPYHFAGHSTGGILAVELARRMQENGHQVASLTVIDSPIWIGFWVRKVCDAVDYCGLADRMRRIRSRRWKLLCHAFIDGGLRASIAIASCHSFAPYPGSITFVRATHSWVACFYMGRLVSRWRRVAQGGLDVHSVKGTHYGLLRGQAAEETARVLRNCLETHSRMVQPSQVDPVGR